MPYMEVIWHDATPLVKPLVPGVPVNPIYGINMGQREKDIEPSIVILCIYKIGLFCCKKAELLLIN